MSSIQLDKKVLEPGNKREALQDVDVPLRDQIVDKLYDKLVELDIPRKVVEIWNQGSYNRSLWLERRQAWLSTWDEHLIADTEGPFEGSSQLHIPMPFIVVKTLHARFFQALWGADMPFYAKARNEASMERVPCVADTLRYALQDWANYQKGIEAVVDQWLWDWIAEGSAVKKWRWDRKFTRFVDVEKVSAPDKPKITTTPDGKTVAIPQQKLVEKEKKVTKKVFDGPCADLVDLEDLLIVGGKGDPDLADVVEHRQWLTASELWTLADTKTFKLDAVEKVIEAGPDRVDGAVGAEIKTQRSRNAGQAQLDTDQDLDRYEILEAYLSADVDDSGINSEVVVWVHKKTSELLRATYLYRISQSGERPFAKIDFILRKGQEYGVGMPEILYPLSKELDALHNMRVDFGLISVMPFGFYRSTSGLDPKTIELRPGALIPTDNPQTDVYFPNMGNRSIFGAQEEQAVQTMIERLTSISDINLGVMSGGQGATRTATGARGLLTEMSSNLDVFLRRLNRGWKKSLRYLLHTLQQRIPAGLTFRLTGDDGQDYWRQIKAATDIAGDFDIEVSPNTTASNAQVQQDLANQVLQMTANPLDIQLGIITPAQRFEALKNWYQANGIRDYTRFVQKPQGYTRTYTPEEEANRVLRGIDVPVTPEMDHQGFLDWFKMVYDNDDLLGQFNEDQTIALARQAKKHEMMLQALQAARAQAANAAQMHMNSQMAQNQSSPGMNPMAGAQAPGPAAGAATPPPQPGPGQLPT